MLRKILLRPFTTSKLQSLITAGSWEDIKSFTSENRQVIDDFNAGAPFVSSAGITYSKITDQDQEEAFDVLSKVVTEREPMAVALKITPEEFKKYTCNNLLFQSKYQELSIVAKDKNKIVGVFVCIDWKNQKRSPPSSPDEISFWKNKLEPLVTFLHKTNTVGKTNIGKIAHGVISGVAEGSLGQGIAKSALALRLGLARTLGYDHFIVECGFGASHAFMVYNRYLQFGSEMRFEDFMLNGVKPFAKIEGGYLFMHRELQR